MLFDLILGFALLAFVTGGVLAFRDKRNVALLTNGTGKMATEETEKEWYDLSWSGKNPERVIVLAADMAKNMNAYGAAKHLASSFYSQVKHLVKKGSPLMAITFFVVSREYAEEALACRRQATEPLQPIDLEVLSAPDFMLAKMPYIGWIIGCFGFWTRAIKFLNAADIELDMKLAEPGAVRPEPIAAGLIWSKLYALTGDEHYKNRVRTAELTKDHDINQMKRIAKHLGFKTLEEFYGFLVI